MKGRAALFHGPGEPFELAELEVPEPEPGALLVRVKQCNICGSDIHAWEGRFRIEWLGARFPTILGHEMLGAIAALGPGVRTDSAGEPLGVGDRSSYRISLFAESASISCGDGPRPVRGCGWRWLGPRPSGPILSAVLPITLNIYRIFTARPHRFQGSGRDPGRPGRRWQLRPGPGLVRAEAG